jgi:hypothetical protein
LRWFLALAGLLTLAACHSAPPTPQKPDEGSPLLRVVYRDMHSEMVLMVPDKGREMLRDDCAAPLLIDTRSGQARVLGENEVQARLKTMQLAGATRGLCP